MALGKKYTEFIKERDVLLEEMRRKLIIRVNMRMTAMMKQVSEYAVNWFSGITQSSRFTTGGRNLIDHINASIEASGRACAHDVAMLTDHTTRMVDQLVYASEREALARLGKSKNTSRDSFQYDDRYVAELEHKSWLSVSKVCNKAKLEVERSYIAGDTQGQLGERLLKIYPASKSKIRKGLISVTTASRKESGINIQKKDVSIEAYTGRYDDSEWDSIVAEYKSEMIDSGLPYELSRYNNEMDADGEFYNWEVEQMSNQEFLQNVKKGVKDAARDAGVTDLLWVAVQDDRTREEHSLKDGLTSSEIDAKLNKEWAHFEDQESVAPSGFNCRCRSIPYIPDEQELKDETVTDQGVVYKDFDEWLNT